MNIAFWHRLLITSLHASLIVLCAGFVTFSMAATQSHSVEGLKQLTTSVAPLGMSQVNVVTLTNSAMTHADHAANHAHGAMDESAAGASAAPVMNHRGHEAHCSTLPAKPCPMPCGSELSCSSVCVVACSAGSGSATSTPVGKVTPRRWLLAPVPAPHSVDTLVDVTLPPLYRPPII